MQRGSFCGRLMRWPVERDAPLYRPHLTMANHKPSDPLNLNSTLDNELAQAVGVFRFGEKRAKLGV
jgi:hypothetical protein